MAVPPGHIVKTGYVAAHRVRLACKERMAIGDVERAFNRRLQNLPAQPWPCPRGHWDEGEPSVFIIVDGRHEYVAALMLGCESILVAWVEKQEEPHG